MPRKPLPRLWTYDNKDVSTWKYLDCIISGKEGAWYVSRWIENPNFKYKYLL